MVILLFLQRTVGAGPSDNRARKQEIPHLADAGLLFLYKSQKRDIYFLANKSQMSISPNGYKGKTKFQGLKTSNKSQLTG